MIIDFEAITKEQKSAAMYIIGYFETEYLTHVMRAYEFSEMDEPIFGAEHWKKEAKISARRYEITYNCAVLDAAKRELAYMETWPSNYEEEIETYRKAISIIEGGGK